MCDLTTALPMPNPRQRKEGRPAALPEGVRIYAIGDIHARLDLLTILMKRVHADISRRPVARPILVFLGDYIDRGPSSRATIDALIENSKAHESVFLKGNHELVALKCLTDRWLFNQWLRSGGVETLISYGIAPDLISQRGKIAELQRAFHDALPRLHLRFFQGLLNSFTCGDYYFVHAGVKPRVALSSQKESDMLWIRDEFLYSTENFGKVVVHGHTPTLEIEILPNRINIDTGAFATGRLSCLVIERSTLSMIDTFRSEADFTC